MKLFYTLMFLILILDSCSSPRLSEKQRMFNEVLRDFSVQIAKEEQMFAIGTGGAMRGGESDDKISEFFFALESDKLVDISAARSITLRCLNSLLDNINKNEVIRPYLEHYPYRHTGVNFILGFFSPEEDQQTANNLYVDTVFTFHNEIQYRQCNLKKRTDILLLKETYEEALERDAQRFLNQE